MPASDRPEDPPAEAVAANAPAGSQADRPANHLIGETSPYLLQHAHNPVDWYPWGEEALARARAEDRPIFLSIGYAACHWCHVMERESFEDEATAAELNVGFVPIKVDREERPDLDQLYMAAVVAMTGQGGWPMSVFLTPEGRPFFGGTYFPDAPRHGMPSFRQVLAGVRRAWEEQRDDVERAGTRLVEALVAQQAVPGDPAATQPDGLMLLGAVAGLESSFDFANGGWGSAPKFPQAMAIDFLLRRAVAGDDRALAVARRSLDRMADGGIRDQLGGGFHRYSTDAVWLVPHFEQMLYDNALLARAYLHAWQVTGDRRYLEVTVGVLGYLERELTTADGAFAASQDADTEGVEGATFTWDAVDLIATLTAAGAGDDVPLFVEAYGATPHGNWEGRTILARVLDTDVLADRFRMDPDEVDARLARARSILLEARRARPQPARDDKAIAAWNGLAIAALAEAARALETEPDPELADLAPRYRAAAVRAAEVIVGGLLDGDGRLRRSWKDGRASAPGVLEDHADLAEGLLALYEATFDERWFGIARQLMHTVMRRFADPAGGFFDVADDHEALVARPRDIQDNATPSGGAMATTVLLKLTALTGDPDYREAAEAALRIVAPHLQRYPSAFAQWLIAADLAVAGIQEVAIVGGPADEATARLVAAAFRGFRPHRVVACAADPATSDVALMGGRFPLNERPTAFVCRDFACRQPVNEPEALEALLVEGEG